MRKMIFTACLIACGLVLTADLYVNDRTARENEPQQAEPGIYVYEESTSPYAVDFYLAGEWEYYPGLLIYSQDYQPSFEGGIGTIDPAFYLDASYQETQERPSHTGVDNIREQASYQEADVRAIRLSSLSPNRFFDHSYDQISSYRMVIQGLAPTTDFDMILSLQGLINGDYEAYIDGNHVSALLPPYGYPTYYFPVPESGTVEIVIQTSHTESLLNITPRVSFKGLAMESFDTYRNALLILTAILFTAFILMMVLMFSLDRRFLYRPFFIGLLFTGNYLLNHFWSTGYQGILTSVIPQYLLPHIAWLMFAGGLALACLAHRSVLSGHRIRAVLTGSILILGLSFLIRTLNLFVIHAAYGVLISDILVGIVILVILVLSYFQMNQIPRFAFLHQLGYLLMITGAISSSIHNSFGFWNLFLYVQPITILIYTIFVFYTNKANQIYLLKRSRELLEIEKKSSKIQAAMLSSQIQPHFLYNTLTTIQELCYSDPDAAADLIVSFSQYLRNNLDFMSYEDLIPFTSELEHIHNFMKIQNARYHGSILYEEDIAFTDFLIPPLSVQPFVENAVKHGIMHNSDHGRVSLRVFETNHHIHITVTDDGEPFRQESLKPNHSIDNIRSRLAYLVNGEVIIDFDNDQETCVELRIPSERKIMNDQGG